jgi:predicted transcriptional regulator
MRRECYLPTWALPDVDAVLVAMRMVVAKRGWCRAGDLVQVLPAFSRDDVSKAVDVLDKAGIVRREDRDLMLTELAYCGKPVDLTYAKEQPVEASCAA